MVKKSIFVILFVILIASNSQAYTQTNGIETNDEVNLHYILTYDEEVQQDNPDFTTVVSPNSLIQGFYEGLLGLKVGDEKNIVVPPDKGYSTGKLAGKTLYFEVKINKLITDSRGADYTPPANTNAEIFDFGEFTPIEESQDSVFQNIITSPIVGAVAISAIVVVSYVKMTGSSTIKKVAPKKKSTKLTAQEKLRKRMEEVEKTKYE